MVFQSKSVRPTIGFTQPTAFHIRWPFAPMAPFGRGGGNSFGQLGNGAMTSASSETPGQIGTDSDWFVIYAGHQSSFGKKTDGTLWAWGKNAAGQLGNGDTVSSAVPILIACPQ